MYLKGITDGVGVSAVRVSRAAATSIPDSTWTAVSFSAEVYDYGGWYSSGTNIVVPAGAIPSGYTTIAVAAIPFGASFAANATGYRGVRVSLNGSSAESTTQPGFASDTAVMTASGLIFCAAADIITLEVYQNSGGALNASSMRLVIARLFPVA